MDDFRGRGLGQDLHPVPVGEGRWWSMTAPGASAAAPFEERSSEGFGQWMKIHRGC